MSETSDEKPSTEDESEAAKPSADEGEAAKPAPPAAAVLDVTGAERAAFLQGFPSDPELDRLVRAFEVGNYAYVREHGPKLAEQGASEKVRLAARELVLRIHPDPLMKYLLLGAVLLLLFLTFYAYHSQPH